VTRLRLRSPWLLPRFFWHAIQSNIQARKAPGHLKLETLSDARFAFWTKSAWTDEASMRAFMLSGPHKKAMPVLANMCDEGTTVHWVQDDAELPTWEEGHRRLQAGGKSQRIRHPSHDQIAKKIPPPRV
jgi:hypothetical protein